MIVIKDEQTGKSNFDASIFMPIMAQYIELIVLTSLYGVIGLRYFFRMAKEH
jgi:hypothetical protein